MNSTRNVEEPNEKARLGLILSEPVEEDLISCQRSQYEKSGSLTDLRVLVDTLDSQNEWEQLEFYAAKLFSATKSLSAAEKLVVSRIKRGDDAKALKFFNENQGLLAQSAALRSLHCWALYRSGKVLKARNALKSVSPEENFPNYSALRRNIAITIGDWDELSQIVADEAAKKTELSAPQLLKAAYLGYQIGVPEPTARGLLFAAVEKGKDDPQVLASAYFLATNAGLDEEPEVATWLHRAAKLSGDDGPIHQASLSELLEKQPEWSLQQEEMRELVAVYSFLDTHLG